MPDHELIETQAGFERLVGELSGTDEVAIDTEFHRERTYYPKLALVQIAGAGQLALVDPLAVDVAPLGEVLAGEATIVMHAADQDLEVLQRACGTTPASLFDTQVAAGFCGMSTPSLAALVERELGVRLPKGDRLTDWLQRPLSGDQRAYAVADVEHLPALHQRLRDRLEAEGRLGWALDECDELLATQRTRRDPDEAWTRIKGARRLRGEAAAVAQQVAAWRERRAAERDQPVRYVLPDLAIVTIAQRRPESERELRKVRGVEARHLGGSVAEEILEAVASGAAAPPPPRPSGGGELAQSLRPAVALVLAWVAQTARDGDLDPSLLATRADVEALLKGVDGARLATGWRAELVGGPISDLVEGRASLAFDGNGSLVLEPRSADAAAGRMESGESE